MAAARAAARSLRVPSSAAGMKLDKFLTREFAAAPVSLLYRLYRDGSIRVNGARARVATRVAAGDVVLVPATLEGRGRAILKEVAGDAPEAVALARETAAALRAAELYRDDDVVAVLKPAGMATQGGKGIVPGLSVDDALPHMASRGETGEPLRLVHRLDKATSGVLLLARTRHAAVWLGKALEGGGVEKEYLALVEGEPKPPSGRVCAPLAYRRGHAALAAPAAAGGVGGAGGAAHKECATAFETLGVAPGGGSALLLARPETGRKHQIRAHLALALGCPVVNDSRYGFVRPGAAAAGGRMMLHCRRMRVPRPDGGPDLDVAAEAPPYWADALALINASR